MDLYIVDHKKLGLEKNWRDIMPFLTEHERQKAERYRFEADKIRSAVGAFLIRTMASRSFPETEIVIERTASGKPYLAGQSGYEFSLSHSGDLIVLATDACPVGVDVERIRSEKDWRIFHRYLSEAEMTMIENAEDQASEFFRVWTIREAFSKEEGEGLAIFDKDFTVDYECKTILYKSRELNFSTTDYPEYKISICSPHKTDDMSIHCLSEKDWSEIHSSSQIQICLRV
jgi:4'-phosphopantetheinyl transferase